MPSPVKNGVVPANTVVKPKKLPAVELEPLGEFNNPYGKPQVAHDD